MKVRRRKCFRIRRGRPDSMRHGKEGNHAMRGYIGVTPAELVEFDDVESEA